MTGFHDLNAILQFCDNYEQLKFHPQLTYGHSLSEIETPEYCGTGKCTASHTIPKKYSGILVKGYFSTSLTGPLLQMTSV